MDNRNRRFEIGNNYYITKKREYIVCSGKFILQYLESIDRGLPLHWENRGLAVVSSCKNPVHFFKVFVFDVLNL